MLTRLAALVAPPLCWGCSAPAPRGSPLCRACARGLRRLPPDLVDLAGVPCFSAVAYEGAARALVRALKFRAALAVADSMAAAIAATAPDGLFAGAALVPVPLARSPRAQPRLQPGAACSHARSAGAPAARSSSASSAAPGRAPRSAATAPSARAPWRAPCGPRTPPRGSAGRSWWTTWPPPARPSRPAPSALRGAGCEPVLAVTYARTLGRL